LNRYLAISKMLQFSKQKGMSLGIFSFMESVM